MGGAHVTWEEVEENLVVGCGPACKMDSWRRFDGGKSGHTLNIYVYNNILLFFYL